MLKEYRLAPLNGAPPARAVIFLHGLGDSGSGGLLEIGRMWQRALPDCEFLCPDAPFAFDMAPPDFGGRQWFSLQSFAMEAMTAGVIEAAPHLNAYIDHVLTSRHLQPAQLALVGFSQGTMMALHVGLRRTEPVACIVGYSGMLAGPQLLAAEKKCAPPVQLIHGTADDVVPFVSMAMAEQALKNVGVDVQTLACPGTAHTIDEAGLRQGLTFLQAHFAQATLSERAS